MRLRLWLEKEGLGYFGMTNVSGTNRGSNTPASDEVKRTGLQPQVGSDEIDTKEKDETEKLDKIDAELQRMDVELPSSETSTKVAKFKQFWNDLKMKWDRIKTDQMEPIGVGLGSTEKHEPDIKRNLTRQLNFPQGPLPG